MCFFWIVCKYKLSICCSFHCIGFFPMRLCKEKESFTQKESFRRLSILFLYPNYPCSSSSLCFQYHSLAAKPFSLCVFWGIFHPLQGAVKSQLWGVFITRAVKISEAGGISSPAALVAWQGKGTHTGQFNSLTLNKITNHPPGIFWNFCYLHTSFWKQSKPQNQEQWWLLYCGEF